MTESEGDAPTEQETESSATGQMGPGWQTLPPWQTPAAWQTMFAAASGEPEGVASQGGPLRRGGAKGGGRGGEVRDGQILVGDLFAARVVVRLRWIPSAALSRGATRAVVSGSGSGPVSPPVLKGEESLTAWLKIPELREWLATGIERELRGIPGRVQVERLEITMGGSVEILLVVGTVMSVIRNYNELIGAIDTAVKNTDSLIGRAVDLWASSTSWLPDVTSTWRPLEALTAAAPLTTQAPAPTRFATLSWRGLVVLLGIPTYLVALALAAAYLLSRF